MAKVTISKLLKTKNRLASEITRTRAKITQYNNYTVEEGKDTTPAVDVRELESGLTLYTNKLIAVKSAINAANVKIADKIYRLAEVKGQIGFYEKLNCTEGGDRYGYGYGSETKFVNVAQIKLGERDNKVKELIRESEQLQDDLDEFNAKHRIEIDDDMLL